MITDYHSYSSSANKHFENFSGWYGRAYKGVSSISNPVNIGQLLTIMRDEIKAIDRASF